LFSNKGKKQVVAAFDGGEITSDGGHGNLKTTERSNLKTGKSCPKRSLEMDAG
jgi:hypothetical protein